MIGSILRQTRLLIWLPLIGKELREKANRSAFYRVRLLFTVALFGYVGYELRGVFDQSVTVFMAGGVGGRLFRTLYLCELVATVLVALITVSARLAEERERGTLELLLTTDLRPWRVVVQKFLAALFPVVTLQMVGLPVVAVYYALGGLAVDDILYGALLLAAHTIHVTALCLFCSAWSRTSGGAFAAAVLVCAGALALAGWVYSPDIAFGFPIPADNDVRMQQWLLAGGLMVLSLIFIFWAIVGLRRCSCASSSPFRFLPAAWALLDRFFRRSNRLIGGRSIAIASGGVLPGDSPLAWRELHRRGLARTSYAIRLFVLASVIAAAPVMLSGWLIEDESVRASVWKAIRIVVWTAYLSILVSIGSGIVATERMRQTLDVLLTVPIDGGSLLLQKASVARRVTVIVLGPVTVFSLTAVVFEPMAIPFLMVNAMALLVVPFFMFWFAVLTGTVIRRRVPALIVSIVALLAMSSPMLLGYDWGIGNPVAPIILAERCLTDPMVKRTFIEGFISAFSLGLLALLMWGSCLLSADRLLGRGSRQSDFYGVWMSGLLNSLGVRPLDGVYEVDDDNDDHVPEAIVVEDE